MATRKELLIKLAKYDGDIDTIVKELATFGRDAKEDLYVIKKVDIFSILFKVLDGEISLESLEKRGNYIECREDLEYEESFLGEIIYELANPTLCGGFDTDSVKRLLQKLKS